MDIKQAKALETAIDRAEGTMITMTVDEARECQIDSDALAEALDGVQATVFNGEPGDAAYLLVKVVR